MLRTIVGIIGILGLLVITVGSSYGLYYALYWLVKHVYSRLTEGVRAVTHVLTAVAAAIIANVVFWAIGYLIQGYMDPFVPIGFVYGWIFAFFVSLGV
jgi:hypothetical protein